MRHATIPARTGESNRSAGRAGPWLAIGLLAALASAAATAQTRPALVRSVDEPARVPYAYSLAPTCPFLNDCVATFPTVPAGKRLRVTNVRYVGFFTNVAAFFAVHIDRTNNAVLMFPMVPFNGAFYGSVLAANHDVDLIFDAGTAPVLEIGVSAAAGGIFPDSRNRLGVTGYLVDVAP
jgi:hypothetical protein